MISIIWALITSRALTISTVGIQPIRHRNSAHPIPHVRPQIDQSVNKMLRIPLLLLLLVALLHQSTLTVAWTCENACGGIALSYPFGSGGTCGHPAFQPYVNCTKDRLYFYTPTGKYPVQNIDYVNNVMIITDSQMSTCNSMGHSQPFGLPVGAPFSFASYDTVAVIGCTSTSSLFSKESCDPSSQQICQSLYNCPGISYLGLPSSSSSASSSCCVLSHDTLNTAPYEIDLPLLQCATYISVYHISNVNDPQGSWLYGIALRFDLGGASQYPSGGGGGGGGGGSHPTCYICEEAQDSYGVIGAQPLKTLSAAVIIGALLMLI